MKYVVSLSGGVASAVAADRAIQRYGKENVILWFANTKWEDADLYRFMQDCLARWGMTQETYTDGRTPLEVAERKLLIPNSKIAPCSFVLKVEPFRAFIARIQEPVTVLLGMDWKEQHRMGKPREAYEEMGAEVDFPLMWKPYEYRPYQDVVRHDWGIEPPRLYALGFPHNNCFAGETRFLTGEGTKTLKETCGQTVKVLTAGGTWSEAEIKSFGEQRLCKIQLKRLSEEKTIYATAEHKWFAYRGDRSSHRYETTTSALTSGTRLVSLYGNGVNGSVRPSAFGIAHGIVYGDGTRSSREKWVQSADIILCGEKNAELLKYFPLSPTTQVPNVGIKVNDLPRSFKDRPDLKESKSYLYGWLAGYFAADGCVYTDGSVTLDSANLENLLFVRDVCVRLGIGTFAPRAEQRTGIDGKVSTLYRLRIMRCNLGSDFFILTKHKERADNLGYKSKQIVPSWSVVSVESTDRIEEVYCAVVPETHCFTLEDNILTGNCGGRCVKQGVHEWIRTLIHFPARFEEMKIWEQAQQAKGGARAERTICSETIGGTKQPLSLAEIERRFLAGDYRESASTMFEAGEYKDDRVSCFCSYA